MKSIHQDTNPTNWAFICSEKKMVKVFFFFFWEEKKKKVKVTAIEKEKKFN